MPALARFSEAFPRGNHWKELPRQTHQNHGLKWREGVRAKLWLRRPVATGFRDAALLTLGGGTGQRFRRPAPAAPARTRSFEDKCRDSFCCSRCDSAATAFSISASVLMPARMPELLRFTSTPPLHASLCAICSSRMSRTVTGLREESQEDKTGRRNRWGSRRPVAAWALCS